MHLKIQKPEQQVSHVTGPVSRAYFSIQLLTFPLCQMLINNLFISFTSEHMLSVCHVGLNRLRVLPSFSVACFLLPVLCFMASRVESSGVS